MGIEITIVDYGMGNFRSLLNALNYVGARGNVSSDPNVISNADAIILPGVGAFASAMQNIRSRNIEDALNEAIITRGRPILGVCLGMQLLATKGTEGSSERGLGWLKGSVEKIVYTDGLRLPHMGFNSVFYENHDSSLFESIAQGADFYFVHSYHFKVKYPSDVLSITPYGDGFVSSVAKGNIMGVQFHPEKSQSNGLQLLSNFLRLCREF